MMPRQRLVTLRHRLNILRRQRPRSLRLYSADRPYGVPRGQIHRAAKSRVVHAFHRTKVADDGLADVYAKSREEWFQTLGFKLRVELFARRFARKGYPASSLDMRLRRLSSPKRVP